MANTSLNIAGLAADLEKGDRRALARAITLIESTAVAHRPDALALLQALSGLNRESLRIAVSGVPGVGKSTFIELLGQRMLAEGHRVAVLAIDPSSSLSGGSIMGDKTRMYDLSRDPRAFVRPSPAGASLGGVARRTREAITLCEAAGFDRIMVETVGVGQSETRVSAMTDLFLLLLMPGSGDELQGIKRGIMELADVVLINKADGELANAANRAAADFRNALRLLAPRSPNWEVPVDVCSSVTGLGAERVLELVSGFAAKMTATGELMARRSSQATEWMWEEASAALMSDLKSHPRVVGLIPELELSVASGELSPQVAANRINNAYLSRDT